MRLTEMVIEQYPHPSGTVHFSDTLTVLVEPNSQAQLADWIGDHWYGHRGLARGAAVGSHGGLSGWLAATGCGAGRSSVRPLWAEHAPLDRETWEAFVCFAPAGGSPSWSRLAELLRTRFVAERAGGSETLRGFAAGNGRGLGDQVASLQSLQVRMQHDFQQEHRARQTRRTELEQLLRENREALERVRGALQLAGRRREELDRRIAELEKRQAPVELRGEVGPHREAWWTLLTRLEELDRHLAACQGLQQAVQARRLDLRTRAQQEEVLTIDSVDHPYHQVRKMIQALEAELPAVLGDSQAANRILEPGVPGSTRDLGLSVRTGLEAICRELQEQYRHVRFRTTAGELKQLRACYQGLEKHGNELTQRRTQLLEELSKLDPDGGLLIARPTPAFQREIAEHGYAQARLRCSDMVPLPPAVLATDAGPLPATASWNELEASRRDRARLQREIEQDEARERALCRERESLQDELQARPGGREALEIQLEQLALGMHRIHCELESLHRRLGTTAAGALPRCERILTVASELLQRMTGGLALRLELSDDPAPALRVWTADGQKQWITACGAGRQAQARLALGLAVLRVAREEGLEIPGWLFEPLRGIEGGEHLATLQVLLSEARQSQFVVVVPNTAAAQTFAAAQPRVCELPPRAWAAAATAPPAPAEAMPPQRWPLEAGRGGTNFTPTARTAASDADAGGEPIYRFPIERPGFHAAPESNPVGLSASLPLPGRSVHLDSPLTASGLLSSAERTALGQVGIETIQDLLQWEPDDLANEIRELPATAAMIDRWQANCWLMVCIPGLAADDARVLGECGILDPEQLDAMSGDHLLRRLAEHVGEAGVRERYRFDRINAWMRGLASTRPLWQRGQGFSRLAYRQPQRAWKISGERWARVRRMTMLEAAEHWSEWMDAQAEEASVVRVPHPPVGNLLPPNSGEPRYHLHRGDAVSALPSLGAKTAQLLGQHGITTVADLLAAHSEELAARLQQRRITADVIRHWQAQAELTTSIPGLTGHETQLLLAGQVHSSQQLGEQEPTALLRRLEAVARTKEGQRLLRGGTLPDLAVVTRWVRAAQANRTLSAA